MNRWRLTIGAWLLLAVACAIGCGATQTAPTTSASTTRDPIRFEHIARDQPPLHEYVVRIDLTDSRVSVGVWPADKDPDEDGPWQMSLQTVRAVATRENLDVAVNGNFFATRGTVTIGGRKVPYFIGNPARVAGWLTCNGKMICTDPTTAASLVVDANGHVAIGKFERLPEGAQHVVSGSQILVASGNSVAKGTIRAPRTAAGIADDGKTLVLLVVDGRLLSRSVGMSEVELADEMIRLGCSDALNLDGGGSSTLVMRNATSGQVELINRPSDGHDLAIPLSIERPIACVLGVRIAVKPE